MNELLVVFVTKKFTFFGHILIRINELCQEYFYKVAKRRILSQRTYIINGSFFIDRGH